MDVFDKAKRSFIMSRVESANTGPELLIRKELHKRGFRYGLHSKTLPGKPDMVFRKYNAVIFVHGCFWHGHNCDKGRLPKSNVKFWKEKVRNNQDRDKRNIKKIKKQGWKVAVIWQCSVMGRRKRPIENIGQRLEKWLVADKKSINLQGK